MFPLAAPIIGGKTFCHGDGALMDCPGCNAEMTDLEKEGERLRVCQQCGGLLIDAADLNRLLLHYNLPGLDTLGGRLSPEPAAAVCRDCLLDFIRIENRERHDGRSYETCEVCGSVFIEGDPPPPSDLDTARQVIVSWFKQFAGARPGRPGP